MPPVTKNKTGSNAQISAAAVGGSSQTQTLESFACDESIPDVWWLTRSQEATPRVGYQCLPPSVRISKRILDIVVSISLLVLLAPVMLIVAILVKITSPGPVIFQQVRVGLNQRKPGPDRRKSQIPLEEGASDRRVAGSDRRVEFSYGRHFTLYKFRTMRTDAEKHGAQFAVKGDPRVTPIGRLMRKTRLDELPQLVNVLKGEMTLVGPRPERPEFIKKLSDEIPDYLNRLGLQPGLTGVAQILNGYDNEIESFRRKVKYDLYYLQHCSLWNDIKILIRTIGVVFTGSGAL